MTVQTTEVVDVACQGCGIDLRVDPGVGTVASPADSRRLTYADAALAVWDCPACGHTDALDLVGD